MSVQGSIYSYHVLSSLNVSLEKVDRRAYTCTSRWNQNQSKQSLFKVINSKYSTRGLVDTKFTLFLLGCRSVQEQIARR